MRRSQAACATPAFSRTSMRVSWPPRENRSCAAPMSISSSGPPPACVVPATRSSRSSMPACTRTRSGGSSRCAAGFRKAVSGARTASRSAASATMGISEGASCPTTSASMPTIRTVPRAPSRPIASVCSSSTGLAQATSLSPATRAYRDSSIAPWAARSSRSGWPPAERAALANSSSAEALIRWTENASATPSITARTGAALRQA
jgi:hypothetical protein